MRLGGLWSLSGHFGEEKNILLLPGFMYIIVIFQKKRNVHRGNKTNSVSA
jgi:hypothetical protein